MEAIIGYKCPKCGNEVSALEVDNEYGPILCARCPDGDYTTMKPVYEEVDEDD